MIDPNDKNEIKYILKKNNVDELANLSICLSLNCEDNLFVENVLILLSKHENSMVRGNAILAFGHLARIFFELHDINIRKIVENAIFDDSDYVRSQAVAAAYDLNDFLGWNLNIPA